MVDKRYKLFSSRMEKYRVQLQGKLGVTPQEVGFVLLIVCVTMFYSREYATGHTIHVCDVLSLVKTKIQTIKYRGLREVKNERRADDRNKKTGQLFQPH